MFRIVAASMQFENRSRMICESMAGPAQTAEPKDADSRGDGRIGDQPVVRGVFLQSINKELRCAAQDRINLLQIFLVPAELVALPQMLAQPRAAGEYMPHSGPSIGPVARQMSLL